MALTACRLVCLTAVLFRCDAIGATLYLPLQERRRPYVSHHRPSPVFSRPPSGWLSTLFGSLLPCRPTPSQPACPFPLSVGCPPLSVCLATQGGSRSWHSRPIPRYLPA